MKSVFLIKTPLQLLNAVEAVYQFELDKRNCVLIVMGDRKSLPQTLMLVESMGEWGEVIVLNEISLFFDGATKKTVPSSLWKSKIFRKSIFNARRLNKISMYLGKVDYMFLGYSKYIYMTHFMNITPCKHLYLLDDGNATLQLAKERINGCSTIEVTGVIKKIKVMAKQLFQGVKFDDAKNLGFFTIYDFPTSSHDHIVKNNYQHIRGSIASLETIDAVYFLGSPLCETGIVGKNVYLKHLERVREYYKDSELIYVCHRRENPENLSKIESELNIKVVMFDYPIEYQLASIGPRPKVLASFFSSALDSCRLIFGEYLDVVSFKLDIDSSPVKEKIEEIYMSYEMNVGKHFMVESNY